MKVAYGIVDENNYPVELFESYEDAVEYYTNYLETTIAYGKATQEYTGLTDEQIEDEARRLRKMARYYVI